VGATLSDTQILRAQIRAQIQSQIEEKLPSAFTVYRRQERGSIPTGIAQIDEAVQGVPLNALTEICGSNLASSGKTSVLTSLLARASRDHFCALVDAGDSFDPTSGHAAGIYLPRLLWVRCGKSRVKLPPLEQAFKVADILLQSGGFGLVAVNLTGIPERVVRRVPLSSWFRFSRVIEKFPAALVFVAEQPHATSCAGLVLRVGTGSEVPFTGNLLTQLNLKVEVVRGLDKKPVRSETFTGEKGLSLRTQWA
jgi:recombination protein RecA